MTHYDWSLCPRHDLIVRSRSDYDDYYDCPALGLRSRARLVSDNFDYYDHPAGDRSWGDYQSRRWSHLWSSRSGKSRSPTTWQW